MFFVSKPLILFRTGIVQCRMKPTSVVEHLDVAKAVGLHLIAGVIYLMAFPFAL